MWCKKKKPLKPMGSKSHGFHIPGSEGKQRKEESSSNLVVVEVGKRNSALSRLKGRKNERSRPQMGQLSSTIHTECIRRIFVSGLERILGFGRGFRGGEVQ